MTPPQTITDAGRRIESLDVLRGLALLGMILVHFHQGFRLSTPGIETWPGEPLSAYVIWWGIEGKAAATFAFLFGVGFTVILRRAGAAGSPVLGFYLRRLLFLALVGAAVEVLTGYVILISLAISGVWLLLFRNCSTRALLILAAAASLASPLYTLGVGFHELFTGVPPPPSTPPLPPASYWEEVGYRLSTMAERYRPGWRYLVPTSTVALFLLGMASLRAGLFDDPRHHVRVIAGAMLFGVASWLAFWLLLPRMPEGWWNWSRHAWPIRYGMGIVSNEWLAFTYMGAVVLLLGFRPRWAERLAAFAAAGRLGLTNYVAQAGIIHALKSEFVLALQLRPYYRVIGAVLLFSVLALFSRAWLSRFRYGPLEWVWRAFSRMELPGGADGAGRHPGRAA